jgi:predicted transposase/invertase (TIGR01784 family)
MSEGSDKVKPTNDYVFKLIFGDEKDKDILISFLNALFKEYSFLPHIEDIELQNSELIKRYDENRSGSLDIKAKVKGDTFIDIEVQAKDTGNLINRGIFYNSFMIVNNIKEGNDLTNIPKVISIWIVKGNLKEDNIFHEYKSPLALCNLKTEKSKLNDEVTTISNNFNIIFIFLSKIEEGIMNNDLENWLRFIDNQNVSNVSNKDITRANNKLNVLRGSKMIKEEYEAMLKDKVKYNMDKAYAKEEGLRQGINQGIKQGIKQGLKQGKEEGLKQGEMNKAKKMAKILLQSGVDINIISQSSGLTVEEIEKLFKLK